MWLEHWFVVIVVQNRDGHCGCGHQGWAATVSSHHLQHDLVLALSVQLALQADGAWSGKQQETDVDIAR